MMTWGTVKSFNLVKGYGFIRQDQGGQDIFVHLSQVKASGLPRLRKGQRLSFEVFDNQGRAAAKDLRVEEPYGTDPIANKPAQATSEDNLTERGAMSRNTPADAGSDRVSVFRSVLEQSLSEAIRASDPECSGLVGVIVEPAASDVKDANWVVKGVRFGRVDRDRCKTALANCVAELRAKFQVSEWSK